MSPSLLSSKSPNEKRFIILTIIAAIITSISGVLLHFAYDFTGSNAIVGLFAPVNESTWEHLKLLFFPMLICLIIMYPLAHMGGIDSSTTAADYLRGIAAGTVTGAASIVILFYFVTGLTGQNIGWLNIAIYFISVIIGYLIFYGNATESFSLTNRSYVTSPKLSILLSLLILLIITACFFLFTFMTPECVLFLDPVTMTYGI